MNSPGGRTHPHVDDRGIQHRYRGADGRWCQVPERTVSDFRGRIGEPSEGRDPVKVVVEGAPARVGRGLLVLEDGTDVRVRDRLPADVPGGYHRLHREDGSETLLIVTPGVCPALERRVWGWAVQIYAARSGGSWGMGDLADLRWLGRWAAQEGAEMLLVSPLGADTPHPPLEPSPYYPSSRRFRNPLYLRVEEVPGADAVGSPLESLAKRGRDLNRTRRIDRDAVWELKLEALESIWEQTRSGGVREWTEFESWRASRGEALETFAVFCAISERHGRGWRGWPEELRRPGTSGVRTFARDHSDRVEFHAWLQWALDRQLREASEQLVLMQDLPIGVDPGGADAWVWQDLLVDGVSVGAPPDAFNPDGQDWGLPPFVPWRLREAGYRPFIETVRSLLAHGSWARIDHVMGLFRLFWIPLEASPADGAYVRYPSHELLAILALEARRAGAVVVGEDLGTVEEGVRDELAARNILSYRLLWFEENQPRDWPSGAMAAVTTHDLPTVAGIWSGSEITAQRSAGVEPDEQALTGMRTRLVHDAGVPEDAATPAAVARVYRHLGRAPCRLLSATLDDAMATPERPNMPSVPAWPNWRLALPRPIEALEQGELPSAIAAALGGRPSSPP